MNKRASGGYIASDSMSTDSQSFDWSSGAGQSAIVDHLDRDTVECDDFDISSLLGMSSLVNRNKVDMQTNAKVIERELLAGSAHGGEERYGYGADAGDDGDMRDGEEWGQSGGVDPVDEYNAMINAIQTESQENPAGHSLQSHSMDAYSSSVQGLDDSQYYSSQTGPPASAQADPWQSYTEEHSNQMVADQMVEPVADLRYDMADENTSDMKLTLLEKIDNLREELEDDGVSIEKIPKVDFNSQLSEVEYVAKLLMLKANRNRYSNMGEEFILAFSSILETLFNGKRQFFGVAPNLTNCSDIVKVKLRRVKNETSQIVSNVVDKYEISPLTTVMIELLPSIFLHSRRRSLQAAPAWAGAGGMNDLSDDINEIRKY